MVSFIFWAFYTRLDSCSHLELFRTILTPDKRGILFFYYYYFSTETCCGYLLEVPNRGTSNEYPQRFYGDIRKLSSFWVKKKTPNTLNNTPIITKRFELSGINAVWISEFKLMFSAAFSLERSNGKIVKHYENTPIQIYRKCHLQKLKIFR